MKKVYVVSRTVGCSNGSDFTNIIHICKTKELAVEYANTYVNDSINDAIAHSCGDPIVYVEPEDVGKYFTEKEFLTGVVYLSIPKDGERYLIKIEEYELRED